MRSFEVSREEEIHPHNDERMPLTYQTSSYQTPQDQHVFQPIDVEDSEDRSHWKWATKRPLVLYLIPFCFLLLMFFVRMGHNDFDLLGKSDVDTDPMHIIVDSTRTVYQVVDNSPLFGNWNNNPNPHVLATAKYVKNYKNNGWHYLHIETIDLQALARNITGRKHRAVYGSIDNGNNAVNGTNISLDVMMEEYLRTMKAMGYVEGYATCHEMSAWYVNFYSGLFDGGDPTDEALEFLEGNHDWMRQQSDTLYKQSDYWMSVKGLLAQLDGMVAGMKVGCPGTEQVRTESPWTTRDIAGSGVFLPSLHRRPSLIHLLLMNANGDLYQIAEKFEQAKAPPSTDYFDDDDYTFDTFEKNGGPTSEKNGGPTPTLEKNGGPSSKHRRNLLRTKTSFASNQRRNLDVNEEMVTPVYHALKGKVWDRQAYQTRKNTPNPTPTPPTEDAVSPEITDIRPLIQEGRRTRSGRILDNLKHLLNTSDSALLPTPSTIDASTKTTSNLGPDAFLNFNINLTPRQRTRRNDHCSVLIKLTDDRGDVLFGHNTWDDFQNAGPRIFKHYSYNILKELQPKGMVNIDFSSSPGLISSVDDFYIVHGPEGHLAVLETSLDIYNPQLLNLVIPQAMLSWTRARLANQMAYSGISWAELFSKYHSGTYVNQWMVMDLRKFKAGSLPLPKFLVVLEEVPGYIHYEDMTELFVNQSYWASYNNPYFFDIARLTGQQQLCTLDSGNCYDTDPRANIFRREQAKVQTADDLKHLLGFNQFATDEFALNNSCNAIACRSDLQPNPADRYPFGAIDSKVSSAVLASNVENPTIYARFGPSHEDDLPPFCWKTFESMHNRRNRPFYHVGHPACFNFTYEVFPVQKTW